MASIHSHVKPSPLAQATYASRSVMHNFMKTAAYFLIFFLFQTTMMNAQNNSNQEAEFLKKMFEIASKYMNRTKHPIITRELLDTLPDDELERAIIDNMHLKMEQDLSDEIIILQKSTIGRQTIYTTWWIEGEVRNGGFNQYFFNSNGIYLPYLLNGLKELNDSDYSSIINKAIQIYEQKVKEQHDSQDGSMEEFMDSYESNPLDALDEEFYKLIKNKPLAELRVNYIRNHYAQFIEK